MAVRNIAVTDTIEKFRTEFNAMTLNDFGDIATLSGSISSTNIVGAVNECIAIISSTAGWTMEDSSSTQQIVGGGQVVKLLGTSNEIESVVSGTNTLTIGLPDAVTVTTSLTAPTLTGGTVQITGNTISVTDSTVLNVAENLNTTGNITALGTTHTLGTIEIAGNTIRSTDSTTLIVNDSVSFLGNITVDDDQIIGLGTILQILKDGSGIPVIKSNEAVSGDNLVIVNAIPLLLKNQIRFEGSTVDTNDTRLQAVDPTADRTVSIPDLTGTIILDTSTGYATSTIFSSAVSLIIYNSAGVAQKTIFGSAT